MSYVVKFNNVTIPSYIKVTSVSYSVLPEIDVLLRTLSGRRGAIDTGTKWGSTEITLDFNIIPDATYNVMEQARRFVSWVSGGNNFQLAPLYTDDETDRTYMARCTNSIDINDMIKVGKGSIRFVVPSGVSDIADTPVQSSTSPIARTYTGTAPTYPLLVFTPSATITASTITFTLSTGGTVKLLGTFTAGVAITIDNEKKSVKIGSVVDMSVVSLETTWMTVNAGAYSISFDKAGTLQVTSTIHNY